MTSKDTGEIDDVHDTWKLRKNHREGRPSLASIVAVSLSGFRYEVTRLI